MRLKKEKRDKEMARQSKEWKKEGGKKEEEEEINDKRKEE